MCAVIEKYYGEDLETARKEARAQGKAEGMAEGKVGTIIGLVASGIITPAQGAAQLNISEDKMRKMVAAAQ